MKKSITTLAILLIATILFAQDFEVPKDYKFRQKEDFEAYEDTVIKAINWLIETPVDKDIQKRKAVTGFYVDWITGCPYLKITVYPDLTVYNDDCSKCQIIFMGGWTKYALESKNFNDNENGALAGVNSVIDYYNNNKRLYGSVRTIDKYIKLKEKGELEKFVNRVINR